MLSSGEFRGGRGLVGDYQYDNLRAMLSRGKRWGDERSVTIRAVISTESYPAARRRAVNGSVSDK